MSRLWRWSRRNRALALTSSMAAVFLLSAVVVSTMLAIGENRNAKDLSQALSVANSRLAENYLDRGLMLCDQGDIGTGMLWLARSLQTAPPDADDLRWAIRVNLAGWSRQLHQLKAVLVHEGPVLAVAYSPDGQTLWTASEDKTVRQWDSRTGQLIGPAFVHPGGVRGMALSPDSRIVATISGDGLPRLIWGQGYTVPPQQDNAGGTLRLWEAATGKPLGSPLTHCGRIMALAFSPDGRTLITGGKDHTARLWQTATAKPLLAPIQHAGPVWAVVFGPDGRSILTGNEGVRHGSGTARRWDAATGKPTSAPLEHGGMVWAVAFSPDGRIGLTGWSDYLVRLWDLDAGKLLRAPLQHEAGVSAAAFSQDGATILTGSYDRTARLWQTNTGQPLGQPLPHTESVQTVAFSPDSRSILTGDWAGTARLWEVAPGLSVGSLGQLPPPAAVVFGPNGVCILTEGQEKTAHFVDAATGKSMGASLWPSGHQGRIRLSPDGRTIAMLNGIASLWDASTCKLRSRLPNQPQIFSIEFSPDSRYLITGSADNNVRFWDVTTGERKRLVRAQKEEIRAVALSPDGRWLATAGGSEACVCDVNTGHVIGPVLEHRDRVETLAFSADGRMLLTTSFDGAAQCWDWATGKLTGRGLQPRNRLRADGVFSPDGRTVLMVEGDGRAQLGDVITGRRLGPPLRHFGTISTVAFALDGGRVVLREPDERTLRIWQVPAPANGEAERILYWTETITGMELDAGGMAHALDPVSWQKRRLRLEELGGPPDLK
jgi:WD40 repeat protein